MSCTNANVADHVEEDALIKFHDTGQVQPGQRNVYLAIMSHDIHRQDEVSDGIENVMSTLKSFIVRVALYDQSSGTVSTYKDGDIVKATLLHENGNMVVRVRKQPRRASCMTDATSSCNSASHFSGHRSQEDVSATLEPPLLGGEAVLQDGVATFKLRITVLSSLCRGSRFRVQTYLDECPVLVATTSLMRTITKLRRGSAVKDKTDDAMSLKHCNAALKSHCELKKRACELTFDHENLALPCRTMDNLWEEVNSNASTLLELQRQQRVLFQELRKLRQKVESCATGENSIGAW